MSTVVIKSLTVRSPPKVRSVPVTVVSNSVALTVAKLNALYATTCTVDPTPTGGDNEIVDPSVAA